MTADGAGQTFLLGQCVAAAGGRRFRAAGASFIASGSAEAPSLVVKAESFAGPLCAGPALATATSAPVVGDTGGSWAVADLSAVTAAAAGSLRLLLEAQGGSATGFAIDLDGAELGWDPPLFADGFESGSTAAWSGSVP